MTHFYERNIVEIKNDYTTFLTNIIAPLIYEGIQGIYKKSRKTEEDFEKANRDNPDVKNPGVLKIFQAFLTGVKNINNHNIEIETNRIKEKSKCSEWFDDLLRAVVKSYIVLLTYNASGKTCRLVHEKYHDKVDAKSFIHKCYVECARLFFNYPELFWHGFTTLEIKRNQREAHEIIKMAIKEAIRKLLPMKLILEEYLKNEYIQDDNDISQDIPTSQYQNMKSMVQKDLDANLNNIEALESDDDLDNELENMERETRELGEKDKMVDLNTLIKESVINVAGNVPIAGSGEKTIKKENNSVPNDAVFGKHGSNDTIGEKHANLPIEKQEINNTEIEMERKLKNPGYIKSPRPVKAGKNSMLKDAMEAYKKQRITQGLKPIIAPVPLAGQVPSGSVPSAPIPTGPSLPSSRPPLSVPLNVAPGGSKKNNSSKLEPDNKFDDRSEDIHVNVVQRSIKPENNLSSTRH